MLAQPRISYNDYTSTGQECQGPVSVSVPISQPELTQYPGPAVFPSRSASKLHFGPQGRLQASRNVIQDGIVPPGHPFLVHHVFAMNEIMDLVCNILTEMAIDRGTLLPPSQVSEGG
jgi:hypothetical protein